MGSLHDTLSQVKAEIVPVSHTVYHIGTRVGTRGVFSSVGDQTKDALTAIRTLLVI